MTFHCFSDPISRDTASAVSEFGCLNTHHTFAFVRTVPANFGDTATKSVVTSCVDRIMIPPAERALANKSPTLGDNRAENSSRMIGHTWLSVQGVFCNPPREADKSCTARRPITRAASGIAAASRLKQIRAPSSIAARMSNLRVKPVLARIRPIAVPVIVRNRVWISPTSSSLPAISTRYSCTTCTTHGDKSGITYVSSAGEHNRARSDRFTRHALPEPFTRAPVPAKSTSA